MDEIKTLLVVWQNEENHLYYHIGKLSHYKDYYEFTYTTKD